MSCVNTQVAERKAHTCLCTGTKEFCLFVAVAFSTRMAGLALKLDSPFCFGESLLCLPCAFFFSPDFNHWMFSLNPKTDMFSAPKIRSRKAFLSALGAHESLSIVYPVSVFMWWLIIPTSRQRPLV